MQPEADSPPGDAGPTAMKLDTPGDDAVSPEDAADDTSDPPAAPQTPDRKPTNSQPPSEARSSRVTINVRTPSRPLETIPSSPLSAPSTKEHSLPTPIPISMDDEVKVSVEETEVEMAQVDVGADTPISSGSAASSPPVELVHVDQGDEDAELEDDEPQVILIQDNPIDMPDPTPDLPFHDVAETYSDTIARLTQYMPSRKCPRPPPGFLAPEPYSWPLLPSVMILLQPLYVCSHAPISTDESVSKHLSEYIERYLAYAKTAGHYSALQSYIVHKDIWHTIPEIIVYMLGRK